MKRDGYIERELSYVVVLGGQICDIDTECKASEAVLLVLKKAKQVVYQGQQRLSEEYFQGQSH